MAKAILTKTVLPTVLSISEVVAMKHAEAVALFAVKDQSASRIFIELGKLFIPIRDGCKGNQTPFGLLQKAGVRKGSISNASQTSRVIEELVTPGLVPEAVFDNFRWDDITAINQAMSGKAVKKQSAQAVADLIQLRPKEFADELESLFATGDTIAEAAAKLKAIEDEAKAKAVADEKAKKDGEAAVKAAAESAAKLAALEKKTGVKASDTPPAPMPDPLTAAADTTAPVTTETPAAAPVVAKAEPAPTNVVQMPPADPDAALPAALMALDAILAQASTFSKEGKEAIGLKLMEMNDALFPVAPSKPATGKAAKKAA